MKSVIIYPQTTIVNVPQHQLWKNRIISGGVDNIVSAQYKMLRTQVLRRMRANNWTSLAVTSPCPGEGKTLTAINLAISLARGMSQTVLLVDFDLGRPSIARYFNLSPSLDLIAYLDEDMPLGKILFSPGIEGLVILPTTVPVLDSSDVLSSPKLLYLVEEMKQRYQDRIVIFDLPPVLAADDALLFSSHVDALMLVVEENKTRKEELKKTLEMLDGVNIVGIVPNKCSDASKLFYDY